MEVSISLNKDSITLGEAVTITYAASGFMDIQLTIPNIPTIDLGGGSTSGTMKVLPLMDGPFQVLISGFGDERTGSDSTCVVTQTASCDVI